MPARDNMTPVNCPICGKTISHSRNLSVHVRTHDKDNEAFMHACPFPDCDFKAVQKINLQRHIYNHTGEFPHRCPECTFATAHPANLTRHRKNVHGYQPTSLDLNRDALARGGSSHSGIPEFQDEFGELTWEKLFPPGQFARFDEQLGAWVPYPNLNRPS